MIIDAVVKPSSRKFGVKCEQGGAGKPVLRISLMFNSRCGAAQF